ncbi:MAG: HAMP domain-containing histidine kinase [Bdellovibrionales bacterium]|nr:HAMP domain-containing histidine kinase [Bdellovibrionales bacterium]
MTGTRKAFFITAICIVIGGLLISTKSHQLVEENRRVARQEQSREVSQWMAQNIEQKINHLEASVSYLDPSTIETLKRMGARYFAYAHPVDGQWKIKWKVLDKMDRKAILNEVNPIPFDKMSTVNRAWSFNKNNQPILISPVEVAQSKQLRSGFLVFGLETSFFSSITDRSDSVAIYASQGQPLVSHGAIVGDLTQAMNDKESFVTASVDGERGPLLQTGYYASDIQAWIFRQTPVIQKSYFMSASFVYFLIAIMISLALTAILFRRFIEIEVTTRGKSNQLQPVLNAVMHRSRESLSRLIEKVRSQGQTLDPEIAKMENWLSSASEDQQRIEDFSQWLDNLIEVEREELRKKGIEIKTQVDDGASLVCNPTHLEDFIRRLLNNSARVLVEESDKKIQIQLASHSQGYQLMYLDTRRSHCPSGHEPSLLLQSESSLETIDGIVAYGSWLFGDRLTVANSGFCLSVDLPVEARASVDKPEERTIEMSVEKVSTSDHLSDSEALELSALVEALQNGPLVPTGERQEKEADEEEPRIVISATEEIDDFSAQSIDDIVDNFEMKDFEFSGEEFEDKEVDAEVAKNSNGLFELDTGNLKIKIRSPRKRDIDVNS